MQPARPCARPQVTCILSGNQILLTSVRIHSLWLQLFQSASAAASRASDMQLTPSLRHCSPSPSPPPSSSPSSPSPSGVRCHATWHAVLGLQTSSCLLGIVCLAACADSCEAAATARLHCSSTYRSAPSGTCLLCREMEGAITLPAQKTSKAAATRPPRPAMDEPFKYSRLGPHLSAANAELRHAPTACIAGRCSHHDPLCLWCLHQGCPSCTVSAISSPCSRSVATAHTATVFLGAHAAAGVDSICMSWQPTALYAGGF